MPRWPRPSGPASSTTGGPRSATCSPRRCATSSPWPTRSISRTARGARPRRSEALHVDEDRERLAGVADLHVDGPGAVPDVLAAERHGPDRAAGLGLDLDLM